MRPPLVTIIGISYNHAPYLHEALASIKAQTYRPLEVILVDDASPDESGDLLEAFVQTEPAWQLIRHNRNQGNCRSFNEALARASGKYVIDLALDDVLLPERVALQVTAFEQLPEDYAVIYTDAELIGPQSEHLGFHFAGARRQGPWPPPSGDIFRDVLARHFISTPTMIMRKKALDQLEGYDEALAYEDFDFWVRSARDYRYHYLDEPLTRKRLVSTSFSASAYRSRQDAFYASTLQVCRKAAALLRSPDEQQALVQRVRAELRQALFTGHREVARGYVQLLQELRQPGLADRAWALLAAMPLPLAPFYRTYRKYRFGRWAFGVLGCVFCVLG